MGGDWSELLVKGLSEPGRIGGFLRRNYEEAKFVATHRHQPSQRSKIAELLEEDRFLLIILDSCRLDYFRSEYAGYYGGDLQQVYTTNTYTKQYLSQTWRTETDVTYVAGGPVIADRTFELSDSSYRPSEHFAEIVDVWDMNYETELGVTPSEAVTQEALACDADQMVVHYFQPHAPYIGDVRLRSEGDLATRGDQSHLETRAESLKEIYEMAESGRIDEPNLREAYVSNLHRVLEATTPLVEEATGRTVITADHGELLGEDGRFFHGGLPHPVLCELPWFEVESVTGPVADVSAAERDGAGSGRSVKEQLQNLGYM